MLYTYKLQFDDTYLVLDPGGETLAEVNYLSEAEALVKHLNRDRNALPDKRADQLDVNSRDADSDDNPYS